MLLKKSIMAVMSLITASLMCGMLYMPVSASELTMYDVSGNDVCTSSEPVADVQETVCIVDPITEPVIEIVMPTLPRYPYTERDLYELAKVVAHEARGEGRDGQVAVVEVVLNRVKSPLFKQTDIHSVLFARGQFSGIQNFDNWAEPSPEIVALVKGVLDGTEPLVLNCDQIVFFRNPGAANHGNNWNGNNATFYVTINHHDFYYSNKDVPVAAVASKI